MAIASVAVEVIPDARGFYAAFIAATRPDMIRAGGVLGADLRREIERELARIRPADIRVRADTRGARADIAALRGEVNRGSSAMISGLLALAPALVPLGAAAAAAGASFVALGGTAALAFTGIKREIDASTPVGNEFAGVVSNMKDSLHELQAVASVGVLNEFKKDAAQLQAQLPGLTEVVASQSVLLGSVASNLTTGLIGGFKTFAPLLDQVGASVERVTAKFAAFATGPSGASLGQIMAADYAAVAPVINDTVAALGHLIEASHDIGLGIVGGIGALANAIQAIPTPVLEGLVLAFVSFRAAAAIQGLTAGIAASFTRIGTSAAAATGPIGLIAAAVIILPSVLDSFSQSSNVANDSAAELGTSFGLLGQQADNDKIARAAQQVDSYTEALRSANGAVNDSVRASVADALAKQDAFKNGKQLGLTQKEITDVTLAGTDAAKRYVDQLKATGRGGIALIPLNNAIQAQAKALEEAKQRAKDTEAALLGVGSASSAMGEALANGNTSIRAYVDAVKAFRESANTAADRGKLIGEVLRAANGPAITYANAITATATAHQQLVTDIVNAKAGVINLKTGMLDLTKAGAAPLAGSLKGLQDAAVNAAAATYQLNVNTKGGKQAAEDAYKIYVGKTRGALLDEADKLGLGADAARKFADRYLGIKNAGDLKKKIELIGQDKVVEALKGILEDLDILVGKKPLVTIRADAVQAYKTTEAVQARISAIRQGRVPGVTVDTAAGRAEIAALEGRLATLTSRRFKVFIDAAVGNIPSPATTGKGKGPPGSLVTGGAAGGTAPDGWFSVGERGPELVRKDGANVAVFSNEQSKNIIRTTNMNVPGFRPGATIPGFADGTGYTGVDYSGKGGNGTKSSSSGGGSGGKGSADITYTLRGFDVNGQKFTTLKEARKAAEKAFKAQANLAFKIDKRSLPAFRAATKKEASDVADTFRDIFTDLRQLGLKGDSPFAKQLLRENQTLQRAVTARNKTADKLKDVQDRYREIAASAKSAITGSFDVTGAGKGFDGNQPITGLRILAEQKQAAVRVRRFVADIKKLRGKINGTYLRQLIEKGPDALPQAEALLTLNGSQLKSLNSTQASINSAGTSLGQFAGETFYRSSIDAQAKQLRNQNASIDRLGTRIERAVDRFTDAADDRPVKLLADGKVLAEVVNKQNAKQKRRK